MSWVPTAGSVFGAKSSRLWATLKTPEAAPDSVPSVAAVALLLPLYSQATESDPGCTACPSGGFSVRVWVAFSCVLGCGVSCVGTFQVSTREEPTSGKAPRVTTKAPVSLL